MPGGNAQWYFNSAQNPFAPGQSATWSPYSAADNQVIEAEFQKKSHKAELQNHFIHFNERMQVHKQDFQRQRPVKREEK